MNLQKEKMNMAISPLFLSISLPSLPMMMPYVVPISSPAPSQRCVRNDHRSVLMMIP